MPTSSRSRPATPTSASLRSWPFRVSATALEARHGPALAVSPLIGGRTVKGPAADMLERLAGGTSPRHVASCYRGLIDTLVFDPADAADAEGVAELGIRPLVAPTLMSGPDAGSPLAAAVLDAAAVRA